MDYLYRQPEKARKILRIRYCKLKTEIIVTFLPMQRIRDFQPESRKHNPCDSTTLGDDFRRGKRTLYASVHIIGCKFHYCRTRVYITRKFKTPHRQTIAVGTPEIHIGQSHPTGGIIHITASYLCIYRRTECIILISIKHSQPMKVEAAHFSVNRQRAHTGCERRIGSYIHLHSTVVHLKSSRDMSTFYIGRCAYAAAFASVEIQLGFIQFGKAVETMSPCTPLGAGYGTDTAEFGQTQQSTGFQFLQLRRRF